MILFCLKLFALMAYFILGVAICVLVATAAVMIYMFFRMIFELLRGDDK